MRSSTLLLAALLAGCSPALPKQSDENCRLLANVIDAEREQGRLLDSMRGEIDAQEAAGKISAAQAAAGKRNLEADIQRNKDAITDGERQQHTLNCKAP